MAGAATIATIKSAANFFIRALLLGCLKSCAKPNTFLYACLSPAPRRQELEKAKKTRETGGVFVTIFKVQLLSLFRVYVMAEDHR
jgi:hypothetical protein